MEQRILTSAQLAAHLQSLRRSRGLTQAQLAAKLGLTQSRLGKIERSPGSISVQQLLAVLAALGAAVAVMSAGDPPNRAPITDTAGW